MTGTSAEHATLTIERNLKAPAARVFAAWADPTAKRQWFACHDEWVPLEYSLDFRVGGAERNHVADTDGVLHAYEARYIDIVPGARIIYAYDMKLGETRISASLTTVTFETIATGTRMLFVEQVAFLDGYADNGSRLQGTQILVDRIQAFVEREGSIFH
ncbi:SRPBCC family protein [Rhizobium sp. Root1220]|uniref:SRPBCC family protein n=1 Tax=Rhizobium sp. Root1220 TaxID=1736432 RepID=UPI0006FE9F8C|nr:SRPBCC family protein [Rhizobium sp. Root1220]KQV81702.1 ATPase [Rhizobium sp. Root1220]